MPVDMKKRREQTRSLAIDVEGDTLNVRYRAQRVTPGDLRALLEAQADVEKAGKSLDDSGDSAALEAKMAAIQNVNDTVVEQVLQTVESWDLMDNGVTVPLTKEGLDGVDYDLLSFVLIRIREDQSPNPRSAPTSDSSS